MGRVFKILSCNLYLRSIGSKGTQEIILAIYGFVLFFKELFSFSFCLLLDQRLDSRKCTWYSNKQTNKQKRKVVSVGNTAQSIESEGDKINDCLQFVSCIFWCMWSLTGHFYFFPPKCSEMLIPIVLIGKPCKYVTCVAQMPHKFEWLLMLS